MSRITSLLKSGNGCTHWWEIEPAHGPTSPGVCKYCGEQRIFFNSIGLALTFLYPIKFLHKSPRARDLSRVEELIDEIALRES